MNILLLGGPRFLGRAIIDAALAAGHHVTTFNRGRTHPELYPAIEKLYGDRGGALDALAGRTWDAVLDTSGYIPSAVGRTAELLAGAVGRYLFVSSISVYCDPIPKGATEDAPLIQLADPTTEEVTGETYGGLKVLCEQAVQSAFGDRALIIRPGLIVGPHDPTHRFTYWVTRVAAGGDVLAPHGPDYPEQVIDVRDLAEWMIDLCELGVGGVFNATGPAYALTLGRMLDTCSQVSAAGANIVWVSEEFLLRNEAAPWSEIPLWIPGDTTWSQVDIQHALANGLTFRHLDETVADTLAWAQQQPPADPPLAGLTWYARG